MGLGIDFGTTRTVVAYSDRKNYPVASFETESGDAIEWFPSLVAERDGELRFGIEALAVIGDPTFAQVRSFKRLLAGSDAEVSRTITIGSVRVSVSELVTGFARALARALRERSNLPKSLRKQASWETVIASPATAFCTQRFVTLDAFRAAGFGVRAMLNEPSAAGFEYSHRHARTLSSKRENVVVYDLGGGTFDASLVRMSGTRHEVLRTGGIAELGGDDFDRVLANLVLAKRGLTGDELPALTRLALILQCTDVKERLGPSTRKVTLDLDATLAELAGASEISLPVQEYYDACEPWIERTLAAMRPILEHEANETPVEEGELREDVAGLYVVGGASAFPPVGRALRARFGRRVHRSPYPHAAVAIGLAIASDKDAGFELDDRFSRNFGVFREADGGRKASYDPIFTRERALPRPGDEPVTVARRYRAEHDVGHFRFFECADFDEHGAPRGDLAPVTDLRFPFDPALRHEGVDLAQHAVRRLEHERPLVEEKYTLDAHGIVHVTFTDLDRGYAITRRVGAGAAP
jgi:molecular chaperone DnaK (HSP70)